MADTLKQTINISTTSTSTEFELVPNSVDSTKTILSIIMCNTTANDCSFDMMMNGTPTGGSAGNYLIYSEQSLPALSTFIHNSKIVVMPNDHVGWRQDGTAIAGVHITTSYLDQT
jgi:ABC-type microcin C transport system permease subunit YejE